MTNPTWDILQGDCIEVMRGMEAESVHCVVTSPPYWGLRSYGHWSLQVLWGDLSHFPSSRRYAGDIHLFWLRWRAAERGGVFCRYRCCWIGCLGLEPTLDLYIQHMGEVFREVWRVLRQDGTCWLNLGDAYASNPSNGRGGGSTLNGGVPHLSGANRDGTGLKPKDLMGLPWRVAFALQADGWWLRSDCIWAKPNPMPESVRDRPTRAHEYVFLLTKSAKYFYDADAIREPFSHWTLERGAKNHGPQFYHRANGDENREGYDPEAHAGANKRTVWSIATQPYSGAHFATFPEKLVEPCILAGTSERGVCGVTGDLWERVVEVTPEYQAVLDSGKAWRTNAGKPDGLTNRQNKDHPSTLPPKHTTTGWRPTCGAPWERVVTVEDPGRRLGKGYHDHEDDIGRGQRGVFSANGRPTRTTTGWQPTCEHDSEPVASVVLDPFCGSGTTGVVALRHGRSFVGIELNPEYIALARKRIIDDAPLLNGDGAPVEPSETEPAKQAGHGRRHAGFNERWQGNLL